MGYALYYPSATPRYWSYWLNWSYNLVGVSGVSPDREFVTFSSSYLVLLIGPMSRIWPIFSVLSFGYAKVEGELMGYHPAK